MQEIFYDNRVYILFAHVLSAVIWVGGMIAMKYAAHPSFMHLASPAERLERVSHALKRLFWIVLIFILILAATGAFLTIGYDIKHTELSMFTHIKEGIWTLMALNFFVMMYRRSKADKDMHRGDFVSAKAQLGLIGSFMVPLNIVLGIAAIFIGAYLSSNL